MADESLHMRHVLLYYFRKGKNARQACEKLRKVYGDHALQERQCQRWFTKFRAGNFDVNDAPRSGRPVEVDNDQIKALIEANPRSTTRDIAEALNVHHSTVHDHLRRLGFTSKLDIWVPHELKEVQLINRMNMCDTNLKRNEAEPFLKRIITGDEKWIVYKNVKRKRSWCDLNEPPKTIAKADIHQKKVMLSIWWDYKGVIFFELLPRNQSINSEVYCRQLDDLNTALAEKRPELINRKGVVFHHDNARPHSSLVTRQKLLKLGWEVLAHPAYSPDLAPSDYHLFRSLQNDLNSRSFDSDRAIKEHLTEFFGQKEQSFYERGIMQLPQRWAKVIKQNGQYLTD